MASQNQRSWHTTERRVVFYPDELKPEDVLDLLKLGLDRSAQTESIRTRQREQRQKMPRKDNGAELSAIDMLAQYLAWLSGRAIAQFRVHLGIPLFDTINVDWVLAVPAEWDIAMEDYREAARQAGLGEVQLVTETEAAAAALISSEQREDRFEELAQDPILVMDAGGGTHNTITYIVSPDGTMKEGGHGTGGLNGGYWLNHYFRQYLETDQQQRRRIDQILTDQHKDPHSDQRQKLLNDLVTEFERAKRTFNGYAEDDESKISFGPIRGFEDVIELSKSTSEGIFAKILDPIIAGTRKQISDFNAKHADPIKDFNKHDFRGDRRGAKWERDCEDNELRGETYGSQRQCYVRGERGLPENESIRFREFLVTSPYELEDHADILHPPNGVKCVGFVEFDVDDMDRSQFRQNPNPRTKQCYRSCQYEVRYWEDHLHRRLQVAIPRIGVFPDDWRKLPGMGDHDVDARLGPGVIYKDLQIRRGEYSKDLEEDPRGIFQYQDAVLERLMVSQSLKTTCLRPNPPRKAARFAFDNEDQVAYNLAPQAPSRNWIRDRDGVEPTPRYRRHAAPEFDPSKSSREDSLVVVLRVKVKPSPHEEGPVAALGPNLRNSKRLCRPWKRCQCAVCGHHRLDIGHHTGESTS
ncbi:MAG: hypothetical protein Q9199_003726 [Rusavskia elegans]